MSSRDRRSRPRGGVARTPPSGARRRRVRPLILAGAAVAGVAAVAGSVVVSLRPSEQEPTTLSVEAEEGVPVEPTSDTFDAQDASIAFSARPVDSGSDQTRLAFTLTDRRGDPLRTETPPSVWVSATSASAAASCEDQVKAIEQGTFDVTPDIDLGSYFILTLNADATVSVIDPLRGVPGVSQLYAMPQLPSRGEDWALSEDGRRLFVTMPDADEVAVIDTRSFEMVGTIDTETNPRQIVREPRSNRLWVANDTDGEAGGVTVIDADTLEVVGFAETGAGEHQISFASTAVIDDHEHRAAEQTSGSAVFVSNGDAGTVSIVNPDHVMVHESIDVGGDPTALAFSGSTGRLYVARADGGTAVIDPAHAEWVDEIETPAGVTQLRFAPGDRYGFATAPDSGVVTIVDAEEGRVAHSLQFAGADRVVFSATNAFVYSRSEPSIELVELAGIGEADPPPTVRVIGGQNAPDQAADPTASADPIATLHGSSGHVLVNNPADKQVYFYMEGMNAPMSSVNTYGATPRAVLVVDRSMVETAAGEYEADVRIPRPGQYRVAIRLDDPQVIHCFDLHTAATAGDVAGQYSIRWQESAREAPAGATLPLAFTLADESGTKVDDIDDVVLIVTATSGLSNARVQATLSADGTYSANVQLREPGLYLAYVTIPSRSIGASSLPPLTLTATVASG